ncbi:Aromatic-amino-acid aminotransferase [Alphaproteobacteria bacterium SO-S41]|nr:Aromatic-amino-acid aminotransferase [Alphaproteobacteria bacterium SO-S41]
MSDGHLFGRLAPQAPDALLSLIGLYRDDARATKLDLGVGVYRDATGATPVLRAVKAAEARLLTTQATKSYLGPEGDIGFVAGLQPIIFGAGATTPVFGVQTPGGTGALRLAADLIAAAKPGARIFMGTPTWPNHPQIFDVTGLTTVAYRYFDPATQAVRFDEMMSMLATGGAGDAVLLQACCHNPTGADLTLDQWRAVAEIVAARGLLPLIDLAYQGLGLGLEGDAAGMRLVLEAAPDALIAYSCDKNFGLYRERTGALYAMSDNAARLELAASNIKALARANWSMPPDHGAAVVRIILEDAALAADWRAELEEMRLRIVAVRQALVVAAPSLSALGHQHGMFAQLPVTPAQVATLREQHAVYMAGSGRINLAGLTPATIPAFATAYAACLKETSP